MFLALFLLFMLWTNVTCSGLVQAIYGTPTVTHDPFTTIATLQDDEALPALSGMPQTCQAALENLGDDLIHDAWVFLG